MVDTPHTQEPQTADLEAKVNGYKRAMWTYADLKDRLESYASKSKEWQNLAGSKDDLEYAFLSTANSLKNYLKSFSTSELNQAQEQGLLTPEECREMVIFQTKDDLSKILGSRSKENSKEK